MTDSSETEKRIAALNKIKPLDAFERRDVHGKFPEVSDSDYQTAVDGFFAFAEKYKIAVEDLPMMLKSYGLMFYRELSVFGFLRNPLPSVAACAGKTVDAVAKSRQSNLERQLERYAKLPLLGEYPIFNAAVEWYAVGDREYVEQRATYYAICEHYGISERIRRILRECMTNMMFWIFSPLAKPYDPESDTDSKVKWQ